MAIVERLRASVDFAGGAPQFSFGITSEDARRSEQLLPEVLDAIQDEMARREIVLGLGIDEFQRLFTWGGEGLQWALKSALERHYSIAYVLTGSSRTVIQAFLTNKKMALWKVVDSLEFGPIEEGEMMAWLRARAAATGLEIEKAALTAILAIAGPRTRDVVQLARQLWDAATWRATEEDVVRAMDRIVDEQAPLHEKFWRTLSSVEQNVLRAMAAEPGIQITASGTLKRYTLGAKSTVHDAVASLTREEILVAQTTGAYTFDDPYFRRWVQRHTLPDIGRMAPPLIPEREL